MKGGTLRTIACSAGDIRHFYQYQYRAKSSLPPTMKIKFCSGHAVDVVLNGCQVMSNHRGFPDEQEGFNAAFGI